jgi:hypothetical protein
MTKTVSYSLADLKPVASILNVYPILKPRAATGEMDGYGVGFIYRLVPALKVVKR